MANGKTDLIKKKLLVKQFKIPIGAVSAQSYKRINAYNVNWYSIPTGYYPIGVTSVELGNSWLSLVYFQLMDVDSSNYLMAVRNEHASSSTSSSIEGTLDVIFAPLEIVEVTSDLLPSQPASDILKEPIFRIKQFTCASGSVSANGNKAFSATDLGITIPSGYEVFSIRNASTGSVNFAMSCCNPFSGGGRTIAIRNRSSSSVSTTVRIGVTFINSKYKEHITIEND